MSLNEADTCRVYITPHLRKAGWETQPHSLTEQYIFTDGRVQVQGLRIRRGEQKRADYLLRYTRDFPIAVVEAKAENLPAHQHQAQSRWRVLIKPIAWSRPNGSVTRSNNTHC